MGDIADYYIEQMQDAYPSWSPVGTRRWTKPRPITCQRCGERDLIWSNDGRGWYLTDRECNPHDCRPTGSADDFDNLDDPK